MNSTSSEMDVDPDKYDMFDRLCETAAKPGIDSKIVQASVLQLVAGVERDQEVGAPIRGEIHLAVVSDVNANLSRFITGLENLDPGSITTHLNGTSTTHSGAIGSITDGDLARGPLLEENTLIAYIEQSSKLDSRVTDALLQILDSRRYSFTKRNHQSTVESPGAVFLAANPPAGSFDDYEQISRQLPISPKLIKVTDLTLINRSGADSFDSPAEPLPVDTAAEYIVRTWSKFPDLSTGALEAIDEYVLDYRTAISNIGVDEYDSTITFGPERVKESMRRLTEAHAKARYEDVATEENAEVIVTLFSESHSDLGLEVGQSTGTFDEDLVVANPEAKILSNSEDEQLEALKSIVSDLELEHADGAPEEMAISEASDRGLDKSRAEELLQELRHRGEVYEPSMERLRTT